MFPQVSQTSSIIPKYKNREESRWLQEKRNILQSEKSHVNLLDLYLDYVYLCISMIDLRLDKISKQMRRDDQTNINCHNMSTLWYENTMILFEGYFFILPSIITVTNCNIKNELFYRWEINNDWGINNTYVLNSLAQNNSTDNKIKGKGRTFIQFSWTVGNFSIIYI